MEGLILRQESRGQSIITRMSLYQNLNENSPNNLDSLLQEKKMQLKSWQEKCQLQNKKIKLFKKENEEIKNSLIRQTQIDTALLLNSKQLSDNNTKLQAAIDQMMKKIEENIDSVGNVSLSKTPAIPEFVTIQSTTVTQQTEELDLASQGVCDDDIAQLKGFKNIKTLMLGENKIGNVGVSTITIHLTAIMKLHLNNNSFTAEALSGIGNLINLRILDIRGNNLGDSCMVFLSHLTTLQQLSISKNALTDVGIKELYDLKNLVYLDLTTNLVTDQGVRSLLQLKKLTHLYMMSNRLTQASVFMIYASLPLIVVLDVRFNINDADKKEEMRAKKPVTMQLFC